MTVVANAQIQKMVIVEEFTGTGCGWCPRGLAGMDLLKATYEDKCIGIALHQYNSSDPMYITKYASHNMTGAPSCTVDRSEIVDPYLGGNGESSILQTIDRYVEHETHAYVESISAVYQDENQKKVDITASINFDTAGDYSVEFVLTGDSITAEGNAWLQSNYYASQNPSGDPLIDQFCKDGEFGQSSFYWPFNDVALTSSCNSNHENQAEPLAPAEAGVAQQTSYTLSLPTKTQILKAMRKDLIFAIVLIIDNTTGHVANAARVHVVNQEEANGIIASSTIKDVTPIAFYNIDGKAISTPQKGINIVKMSDGTTRKIMY